MRRKFFALLFAVVFVFTLSVVGCKKKAPEKDTKKTEDVDAAKKADEAKKADTKDTKEEEKK
jgi:hypothetical protein